VLSKLGLRACHPVAATQIRVLTGIVGFALVLLVLRRFGDVLAARRDGVGLWWTLGGSICGPCVGVTLSLLAVQHTQAGVAASIMATTPILILPAVALRGEHVGVAGVLGALVTVAGVAVLFLA
jgi:drug/metabolite transporter (DMT)-like permease